MTRLVDLSADVGEHDGDLTLLEVVTSASVACGGHAGDDRSMREALARAAACSTAVGAHPSYADRDGFGRRELGLPVHAVAQLLADQVGRLSELALVEGGTVSYVKAHGAMYHRGFWDGELASAICETAARLGCQAVLAEPGAAVLDAAPAAGLYAVSEGFCDRAYLVSGRLAGRDVAGSVLSDPAAVVAQGVALALGEALRATDGSELLVEARSICLHGDTPGALELARALRREVEASGVEIAPFASPSGRSRG